MADGTGIEWTDATWNPIRGCSRVSAGCQHCYAERVAARFSGPGQPYEGLIHPSTRGWNGRARFVDDTLTQPLRWRRPRRIFVNSMSDLFHESLTDEQIAAVFGVMAAAPQHTFQVLTKRPERMLSWFRFAALAALDRCACAADDAIADRMPRGDRARLFAPGRGASAWPLTNVWLGVSVENQAAADERIPLLLQTPAAVRWISAEPLLGPVSLRWLPAWNGKCLKPRELNEKTNDLDGLRKLDWVVAGGESGLGARPMHPDWVRSLRDQCAAAGVPMLFKQWGEWAPHQPTAGGDEGADLRSGRVRYLQGDGREPDGRFRRGDAAVARVGKRAAGRLLDGVLHDAYPEVVPCAH